MWKLSLFLLPLSFCLLHLGLLVDYTTNAETACIGDYVTDVRVYMLKIELDTKTLSKYSIFKNN